MNLIRCAWVGSQRYGALAWSGDVPSTFTQLKNQVKAGLNMGIAGIPWWTADIGGFHGGNIHDPAFQELLMRWFQFGAFCPVMRLHGDRDPHDQAPLGTTGGGMCGTGASNEVWSYPKEVEDMMVYYIGLRNRLRPYIAHAMEQAHQTGTPVIRPLFMPSRRMKTAGKRKKATSWRRHPSQPGAETRHGLEAGLPAQEWGGRGRPVLVRSPDRTEVPRRPDCGGQSACGSGAGVCER